MPDVVVAVIQLSNKVGVLYFPRAYTIPLEKKLKSSRKFRTVDFPGYHTNTLPTQIKEGNLDGLICKSIRNVRIDSEQYKLYLYKAPFDAIYEEIIRIKQKNRD